MATTIIGYPASFTPAFNQIYFYLNSTNKTNEGFKYIVDIFSATTSTKIGRYKLFPRPVDGYGVADMQQLLATQISYFINPTSFGFSAASQNNIYYDVYGGEEYVAYWNFYDNYFSTGNAGFTGTTSHGFIVGDQVYISQNITGNTNTQYNGVHNIISSTTYSFVIDVGFGSSTPPQAGTAVYADHRKTQFTGQTSVGHNVAWNAAFTNENFHSFNSNSWIINSPAGSFLTNMPSTYRMKIENNSFINFYSPNGYTQAQYLVVKTSNGGEFHYTNPVANFTPYFCSVALGANSLNNFNVTPTIVSGTLPPITTATTSYTAFTMSNSSAQTSNNFVVNVDNNIDSRFTNYEILWMDKMGSFVPTNFELGSKKTKKIKRSEYQKILGNYNGATSFTYNTWDRGRTSINTTITTQIVLTSSFLTEAEATYIADLYDSQQVFIKINGNYFPVIVIDQEFPYPTKKNNKLLQCILTIELANADRTQNLF